MTAVLKGKELVSAYIKMHEPISKRSGNTVFSHSGLNGKPIRAFADTQLISVEQNRQDIPIHGVGKIGQIYHHYSPPVTKITLEAVFSNEMELGTYFSYFHNRKCYIDTLEFEGNGVPIDISFTDILLVATIEIEFVEIKRK